MGSRRSGPLPQFFGGTFESLRAASENLRSERDSTSTLLRLHLRVVERAIAPHRPQHSGEFARERDANFRPRSTKWHTATADRQSAISAPSLRTSGMNARNPNVVGARRALRLFFPHRLAFSAASDRSRRPSNLPALCWTPLRARRHHRDRRHRPRPRHPPALPRSAAEGLSQPTFLQPNRALLARNRFVCPLHHLPPTTESPSPGQPPPTPAAPWGSSALTTPPP